MMITEMDLWLKSPYFKVNEKKNYEKKKNRDTLMTMQSD